MFDLGEQIYVTKYYHTQPGWCVKIYVLYFVSGWKLWLKCVWMILRSMPNSISPNLPGIIMQLEQMSAAPGMTISRPTKGFSSLSLDVNPSHWWICVHKLHTICMSWWLLNNWLSKQMNKISSEINNTKITKSFYKIFRIRLRPRILRDVSVSDIRTTILGTEISFPVGIAPTAFHCLAWHEGELATARGKSKNADILG